MEPGQDGGGNESPPELDLRSVLRQELKSAFAKELSASGFHTDEIHVLVDLVAEDVPTSTRILQTLHNRGGRDV